jgi:hypothetical protein
MRWVVIILAVLAGIVLLLVVVGLLRPKGHVARTQAKYSHPPDSLWATLADFEHWGEWNPEVKSVTRLPERAGHTMLKVIGTWGEAPTEITVWDPPRRLETQMDAGAFRGGWTYELAVSPEGGTVLTVTERGEVDNPVFRAMMMFHDNHATMLAFHRALAGRLRETVEPVPVAITGQ